MSIKAIHIIFITASTLLAFGFGAWLLHSYTSTHAKAELIGGIVSIVAGFGLIAYGKYFLNKLRNVSYL